MEQRLTAAFGRQLVPKVNAALVWTRGFCFYPRTLLGEGLSTAKVLVIALFYSLKNSDLEIGTSLIGRVYLVEEFNVLVLSTWIMDCFQFETDDVAACLCNFAQLVVEGIGYQFMISIFCRLEEKYELEGFFFQKCYILSGMEDSQEQVHGAGQVPRFTRDPRLRKFNMQGAQDKINNPKPGASKANGEANPPKPRTSKASSEE